MNDFEIIGVIDYDIMYFEADKAVCGIANLIKSDADEFTLSHEHSQYRWVSREELGEYAFVWPNTKRMLEKGFEYNELLNKTNGK